MKYLKDAIIFAVGASVGYFVCYKTMKTYYEDRMKEVYSTKKEKPQKSTVEVKTPDSEEVIELVKDYATQSKIKTVTNYSDFYEEDDKVDTMENDKNEPYSIEYDDYNYDTDHEKISFTLYSDGALVDEMDEPVESAEEKIGKTNLIDFIRSDEDEIYIRNEEYGTDYEITKSNIPFNSDVF